MIQTGIEKIGILTGGGDLPLSLIKILIENAIPFAVIGLKGQWERDRVVAAGAIDVIEFRMGAAGSILDFIEQSQISHIVFAGSVKRPSIAGLRPDITAMQILAKTGAMSLGDDGLLTALTSYLQDNRGLQILSPSEILSWKAQNTVVIKTDHQPNDLAWSDIKKGASLIKSLSAHDVGQSVVIQQHLVLGIEAIEGTDQLLERSKNLARPGQGGVLVKLQKEGQNQSVDLPTIGPQTIENAEKAGLSGIAIDGRGMIVLHQERVEKDANSAGLFIVTINPDDLD